VSGSGAPSTSAADLRGRADGLRVRVVAASWHAEVMDGLVEGALRAFDDAGLPRPDVVRVPGAFELPVVARACAVSGADAVVALGVVVRGGTPHFEYVCQAVTAGLTQVAVSTGVPVGFGVLTCDDDEQARQRAGLPGSSEDKGYEAAVAAMSTALAVRTVTASS
jgi:6,7-dimethyl-8-ribityllumazine synthase